MQKPEDILEYWLDTLDHKNWYQGSPELDADIRTKFLDLWQVAMEGACGLWLTYPTGTLAYIILTDQFSRNMFRNEGKAFSSDRHARAAAKGAIARDWDLTISIPARQFMYMPLVHSENLVDQDRAVRLIATRMEEATSQTLLHARAHREVIRQFGRFPFRNAALGRPSTPRELLWLENVGYGKTLKAVEAQGIPA